jgi:hypothetical protein
MFKQAGIFKGKVLETKMGEPRFSKEVDAFDVCLLVEGPEGQSDWWRGEISAKYGTGNYAGKTQAQITIGELTKIGFVGQSFHTLDDQFVGKEISYTVVERTYEGKSYYDVKYIGSSDYSPQAISTEEIDRRMAAMGLGAAPAAPAPAPVAPAPAPAALGAWPTA